MPRREALRGADFRRIFHEGHRVTTPRLVVHSSARPGGGPGRYGLAVSRRFGNAVERNRIRRQIRSAVDQAGGTASDYDFVITPKADATLTVADMASDLWEIMESKRNSSRKDAR